MPEKKEGKLFICVSSKGGVGKSTLADEVVATYVYKRANKLSKSKKEIIRVIEVDDNNKSDERVKDSNVLIRESHKVKRGSDEAQMSQFDVYDGRDVVIDAGGSNDSIELLNAIDGLGLEDNCVFFIPLLKNKTDMKNVKDTYDHIRKNNKVSKIVFILNQAVSMEASDLREQFKYFFEDDSISKKTSIYNSIKKDDKTAIISVLDTDIFDFSSTYQQTAFEIASEAINMKELSSSKANDTQEEKERTMAFIKTYKACKNFKTNVIDVVHSELDLFLP